MSQQLLLDTRLLPWAALFPERLPEKASRLMGDAANTLYFSIVSIWEIFPDIHKDPFDRLLLAQAMREDLTLVTADELLASFTGPILKV